MADKPRTIVDRWGISVEELTAAIDANPSLRGILFGYVAEHHLRKMWFTGRTNVTAIIKYDDHDRKKKGDLVVAYKGHPFKVECKSLQTASIRKGDLSAWVRERLLQAIRKELRPPRESG